MKESISSALSKVKVLDLSLKDFKAKFGHIISFDKQGETYSLAFKKNIDIIHKVTPNDIKTVLNKCLRREISSEELQEWANFLILCDVYKFTSEEDGKTSIMSTVLHKIANEEITSGLTDGIIRYYFGCIESKQEPTL